MDAHQSLEKLLEVLQVQLDGIRHTDEPTSVATNRELTKSLASVVDHTLIALRKLSHEHNQLRNHVQEIYEHLGLTSSLVRVCVPVHLSPSRSSELSSPSDPSISLSLPDGIFSSHTPSEPSQADHCSDGERDTSAESVRRHDTSISLDAATADATSTQPFFISRSRSDTCIKHRTVHRSQSNERIESSASTAENSRSAGKRWRKTLLPKETQESRSEVVSLKGSKLKQLSKSTLHRLKSRSRSGTSSPRITIKHEEEPVCEVESGRVLPDEAQPGSTGWLARSSPSIVGRKQRRSTALSAHQHVTRFETDSDRNSDTASEDSASPVLVAQPSSSVGPFPDGSSLLLEPATCTRADPIDVSDDETGEEAVSASSSLTSNSDEAPQKTLESKLPRVSGFFAAVPTIIDERLQHRLRQCTLESQRPLSGQQQDLADSLCLSVKLNSQLLVTAGTVDSLIETIFHTSYPKRKEFTDVFLLTYTSFTNEQALLQKLRDSYLVLGYSETQEDERSTENINAKQCRLLIVGFLKKLLSEKLGLFEASTLENFESFARLVEEVDGSVVAEKLRQALAGSSRKLSSSAVFDSPAPPSLLPKRATEELTGIHPLEMARQLTILDSKVFRQLTPDECLYGRWSGSEKLARSPNVCALIAGFNQVNARVISSILLARSSRKRVKLLEWFLQLLYHLRELQNFHGVMSVLSALQSSPLFRLKKMWLAASKKTDILESTAKLMSPQKSCKEYREVLGNCSPPLLPYIGVYLTDLTFIEDGNPNLKGGLINFQKHRMCAEVLRQIRLYQQTPYNLVGQPSILEHFQSIPILSEDEQWELSLQVERRATEKD